MGNEIVSIQQADQFVGGYTAYACGFFAIAECCSMSPPGQAPTKSAEWIQSNALSWYAQYDGDNSSANDWGMSLAQLYTLIQQVGLHYQAIDAGTIRAWIAAGYPVVVAVAETAVLDLALGANPYPWTPAGNHIIVLTGLDGSNFLVRDSANIEAPNTLRPGPRRYDAGKLIGGLVSTTVVVPSWLPRPTSANPPTTTKETNVSKVPTGWHDNSTELVAPNGVKVVRGFRDHVLNHSGWDANNWPLENEQGLSETELAIRSGGGTRQIFRTCMLVWYASRGVVEAWVGSELFAWIQKANAATSIPLTSELRAQLITLATSLTTASNTIDTVLKNK